MPIRARLPKSGAKKVVKHRRKGTDSKLDAAGRTLHTAKRRSLTPGTAGLTEPLKTKKRTAQQRRSEAPLRTQRRRHVADEL